MLGKMVMCRTGFQKNSEALYIFKLQMLLAKEQMSSGKSDVELVEFRATDINVDVISIQMGKLKL